LRSNLSVTIVAVAAASISWQAPREVPAAAIVSALSGSAVIRQAGGNTLSPIACFDWIAPGSQIEVTAGSRLVLVLLTGTRFELLSGSTASVSASGLTKRSGEIRQLASVPAIPRVEGISPSVRPGASPGGVRLRGEQIAGLYPSADSVTLAGATVLSFSPVKGASRYRVTVEDRRGAPVFSQDTESTDLALPSGRLRPAATYYWKVETLDRIGGAAEGQSGFATLSANGERARRTLNLALEADGDARSLALLAEIDRKLGLLREARERLRGAAAKAPDDTEIQQALIRIEQQLQISPRDRP
jgi:hypothetical protein